MQPVTRHNNFIVFTLSLVALLLAAAIGRMLPPQLEALFQHAVVLGCIVVAYVSLSFGPYWHRFIGSLFVLALLANTVGEYIHAPTGEVSRHLVALIFFLGSAYNASRQVLMSDEIKANIIVGALAIYLLLGLVWAALYQLIIIFFPTAFHGIETVPATSSYPELLYFSYVTLATPGYGDITPAIPLTRTLAYLEAIAGTFYLAIVVASLIGARKHRTPH